jgi:gamma-D-glutamyl-L-lysine dipeptidyl-peptidase
MTGIVTLALVPLRESDNDSSELYSQLLFGECVEIQEIRDRWLFVRNLSDDYTGWVDRKMILMLDSDEDVRIAKASKFVIQVPFVECYKDFSGEKLFLPGGSILPDFVSGKFAIANETYEIKVALTDNAEKKDGATLVNLAKQYLNTPYLLGGKSVFGIDCSGLVQVITAMAGIQLPHDAAQQVEFGTVIDFLDEVNPGDLAFFENSEGKIIHVGILLNSSQIIHSCGWVKIETIDSQGIISSQNGEYTHNLRVIKRLF